MSNYLSRFARLFFVLLAFSFCSCSMLRKTAPSPEEKMAVLHVVDQYLRYVVAGDKDKVASMIIWAEYLTETTKAFNQDSFFKQLSIIKGRWPREENPMLGLDVVNLEIGGDLAKVRLRKLANPQSPEIWVQVVWVGRGWMVRDDSLFGQGNLIEKLGPQQEPQVTQQELPQQS